MSRLLPISVLLFAPLALSAQSARTPRPHVLLIVADDLRADVISAYGGPVETPNIDRLAARGCLFTRATCGYPICHVSRTEMLTGRSLVAEAAAGKAIPIEPEWDLLPQVMDQSGWYTVYAGKWHMHGTPWQHGYAETAALFSAGGAPGMALTLPRSATGRGVTGYKGWTFKTNDEFALPELGIGLTPETDARIATGSIGVIRTKRERPWFLHVNFTAPHDPLHWPRGWENRTRASDVDLPANYRKQHPFDHGNIQGRDEVIVPAPRSADDVQRECAVYYGLAGNLDVQVGRILQALEASGDLERTLVIFTSDHGLALGSHGLMGKQNQYEHTVNVPLIMSGPGIPAGRRLASQCALRDLFPTICELAGVAVPGSVQAKSLVPVFRAHEAEVHEAVFGYFTDTQRMIRTADGWKLIWYPQAGRVQLFRAATDTGELHNLVADPAQRDRVQRMMRRLKAWLRGQGDAVGEW